MRLSGEACVRWCILLLTFIFWCSQFIDILSEYCQLRGLDGSETCTPKFPTDYGFEARDAQYHSLFDLTSARQHFPRQRSWGGWDSLSACMIAYDAYLHAEGRWLKVIEFGALHAGDNDSTGAIAGAWFGAQYGFAGIPENHTDMIEFREQLTELGAEMGKFIEWISLLVLYLNS